MPARQRTEQGARPGTPPHLIRFIPGDREANEPSATPAGAVAVTMERIRTTMLKAWAKLNGSAERQRQDPPRPGRPRDAGTPATVEEADALGKSGFAEEALPWMDAVHRFALRLTRDRAAAEDLVQETYPAGVPVVGAVRARHELPLVALHDLPAHASARAGACQHAPDEFFDRIVDERLVAAIDALPEEFREPLILSDLADLDYAEIADVLDIPVGTVKSRLSRARRRLRDALLVHGIDSPHAMSGAAGSGGLR